MQLHFFEWMELPQQLHASHAQLCLLCPSEASYLTKYSTIPIAVYAGPSVVQVYDLSEYRPDKVLRQIWQNLQHEEQQGNQRAALVRSRLRILACGGDGTIAWILKVIHQMGLQPQPAVAIMPLGTGAQRVQR
jgi:hypothetical protein